MNLLRRNALEAGGANRELIAYQLTWNGLVLPVLPTFSALEEPPCDMPL